jgi:hypothetical protein
MEAIASVRARLEKADSQVAMLSVAGEAFRLVCRIADEYAVPGSESFATWAWVIAPACEGLEALGADPSIPRSLTQNPEAGDLPEDSEDETADLLAGLAASLVRGLASASAAAETREDRRAFQRAADAAEKIRELLAADE